MRLAETPRGGRLPRRALPALPLLLAGGGLAGCGLGGALFGPDVAVRRIAVSVAPGANGNAPVALDLAMASDRPPLAESLGGLSAAEWFVQRAQLRRDWPRDLWVRSWELVPGQILAEERLPAPPVSAAGFLFALYQRPGVHRARLAQGGRLLVRLLAEEMQVQEA